jgi:probable HAF family extracellular repeat protein
MRSHHWVLGITALTMLTGAAQANRYMLIDIGAEVWPPSINDSDFVAGSSYSQTGARLWNGDHWHKLERGRSEANAINSGGAVVGNIYPEFEPDVPVLWRFRKPALALPLPPDSTSGWAYGVNDATVVVGGYLRFGHTRCFMWTEEAGSIDMGLMGNGESCGASAINDKNQVTGGATTRAFVVPHAFRYEAGVFEDLGSLTPGGHGDRATDFSDGTDINNHGDVVGYSTVATPKKRDHAVLWRGTEMIDLNRDSTFLWSRAFAINDRGDIVGHGTEDDENWGAVRFTNPGIIWLDSEVINLGRWKVVDARSVNELGDIAARAIGPGGQARTVILKLESRN